MNTDISYLQETNLDINEDILYRKEFLLFKKSIEAIKFDETLKENDKELNIIPKFIIKDNISNSNYLELKSYQMLVRNYLNPNTPFSRLLLKWNTGSGKTVAALSIAMNFIETYKKLNDSHSEHIGSVFVIGFTQNIFKDELLKYPEFGFISRNELTLLKNLKKAAYNGNTSDVEKLKIFVSSLRKRITNRKENGYFKFIGYKELANNLFKFEEDTFDEMRELLAKLSADELIKNINNGKIKINKTLLNEFSNSLLICDEIHNVYNTVEKNNWGIALQTILNYHNSCRALFLSATPLNNSPTELIDLLNLILPRRYYKRIEKSDFFTKVPTNEVPELIPEKIKEIENLFLGRISFIKDSGNRSIASSDIIGSEIPGIKYLKFIRCKMSDFHLGTYKVSINGDRMTMGKDGLYLLDIALPDPDLKSPYSKGSVGIYKQKDIESKIKNAPAAWKKKYGIDVNKEGIVDGSILSINNIEQISSKYYNMLKHLINAIKIGKGKSFVYHNFIHGTGTLFIMEIMLQNNIIGEYDNSSDNTLCSICGESRKSHKPHQIVNINSIDNEGNNKDHTYQPVRFAIIHSDMEKSSIGKSLERYNSNNNIHGERVMILIGSKIIKESHSLSCVRNIFITSRPDNISTLIQIFGRGIRLGSHNLLPIEQRHVEIKIFVSSLQNLSELSVEEYKYMEKVKSFLVIQEIEKLMHEAAIDKYFNYDTIWKSLLTKNEKNKENKKIETKVKSVLDILHYNKDITFKPHELNLSTFNVYYAKNEVKTITYIIKRLFIEISNVWTYNDLFNGVKRPPFNVEINVDIISQDLFNIALNGLLYNPSPQSSNYVEPFINDNGISIGDLSIENEIESVNTNETNLIDRINDPLDKIIIIIDNTKYVIQQCGELYSLIPIYNNEIFIDTEVVFRNLETKTVQYVDIINYLKVDSRDNYEFKKDKFIQKWKGMDLVNLEQSLCDYGTAFHVKFIQDIIEYVFKILTTEKQKRIKDHLFYMKMLYFYDLHNLIAWTHVIDNKLEEKYKKFITPVKLNLEKHDIKNKTNETNMIISTINRSDQKWISDKLLKAYQQNIANSEKLFNKIFVTGPPKKVSADLLPVGHYLGKIPKMYYPNTWFDWISHSNKPMVDNNIIVGYDSRSSTGMSIKFKLRQPIKSSDKIHDVRDIEKGMVCSTKSKKYLEDLAEKLGIKSEKGNVIESLCTKIRNKLIYNELLERSKNSNVKWFYTVLEEF
jgi:superfamily II DNA or RNA helicase